MSIINKALIDEFHEGSIVPKIIKKGSKIQIKHYSSFEPVINIVHGVKGNRITMDLPNRLLENNVLVDDVITCVFMEGDTQLVLSGIINDISLNMPHKMVFAVENVEKMANHRKNSRYSVSLSSNVQIKNSDAFYFAVVKNISVVGVSFTCNIDVNIGEELLIKVAVAEDEILTFTGRIVRKRQIANFSEYGLLQSDIDEYNMTLLEKYIQRLAEEEEKLFGKLE